MWGGCVLVCKAGPGLVCRGTPKICRSLRRLGQGRSSGRNICETGIVCDGKCKRLAGHYEECNANTICPAGTVCASGPPRRCIRLKALGMVCPPDDPWWVCKSHLTCRLQGYDHICQQQLEVFADCSAPNTFCLDGFTCAGLPQICSRVKNEGQVWGRRGTICRESLKCRDNHCKSMDSILESGVQN